jgi:hypothetical protein
VRQRGHAGVQFRQSPRVPALAGRVHGEGHCGRAGEQPGMVGRADVTTGCCLQPGVYGFPSGEAGAGALDVQQGDAGGAFGQRLRQAPLAILSDGGRCRQAAGYGRGDGGGAVTGVAHGRGSSFRASHPRAAERASRWHACSVSGPGPATRM